MSSESPGGGKTPWYDPGALARSVIGTVGRENEFLQGLDGLSFEDRKRRLEDERRTRMLAAGLGSEDHRMDD